MESNSQIKRIAVFASGNGTNAENLIRYFGQPGSGGEVVLVVANRPDAMVLQRASRAGVPACVMTRDQIRDQECLLELLDKYAVDIVVLAGFLLMIPPFLIERYAGRIVNLHPSLLPKFGGKGMYGRHVHEAVVAAGEAETGITIHMVSERYDEGRVLFQASVALEPTDTPASVEAKVRALEQEHFARVVRDTFIGV